MIILEEAVDMVPETVRPQARAIRVRRLVLELPDLALKVVRCLCTDVFLREDSRIEIQRKSLLLTLAFWSASTTVDVLALVEAGIVKNPRDGVKILGNGELTKKLDVKADAFSASAKEKIEAVGGTAEVM